MSKGFFTFPRVLAVLGIFLHLFNNSEAQSFEATVGVTDGASKAHVVGRYLAGKRSTELSFLPNRGSIVGLGSRISGVEVSNGNQKIASRKFGDGEYRSDGDLDTWSYDIDLSLKRPADAAHVSWISGERGVLMTDDLFPRMGGTASGRIRIELPAGWQILSGADALNDGWLNVSDVEKTVVVVGKAWRSREVSGLNFVTHGDWPFSDDEASSMAAEIYGRYKKLFGGEPQGQPQIVLSRFPGSVAPGNWEAEARGNTVLILSSDMPFPSQSKQRLHEQLRHELFHLWLPNGVRLKGNYDWFYEGFAMYESLRLAVSLNRIRFDDYLDTLSRARFIAEASPKKRSLIEASNNRFLGSETELYARGMATAFLCDLAMLDASGGKRSVDDIVRRVFQKYRVSDGQTDGSEAVTGVMNEFAELRPIVERHIKGTEKIDWQYYLSKAGIDLRPDGTTLLVTEKPTKRQRALLDELGYNNWRNLSSPTR